MIVKHRRLIGLLLVGAGAIFLGILSLRQMPPTIIRGTVVGGDDTVAGAVVRVQGMLDFTTTDEQGAFALPVANWSADNHITAWAPGYYITSQQPDASGDLVLALHHLPAEDNADYNFISPVLDPSAEFACGRCHSDKLEAPDISMPVSEWLADAHSSAAINPRFLSLYNGTSLDGTTGAPTTYQFDADVGIDVPVASAPDQAASNAGFRLDFPDETGVCANCHVPILALDARYQADPNQAQGVAQEGVTCDFCHKISDVKLRADGLPSPQLPGIQSLEFLRPVHGEQVFLGPLDDVPGEDTYSALQKQSQYCAACHTGTFWGVSIYNSFGEWLASPYSDAETGKTCQDCHMPHLGETQFVQLPPDVNSYVPVRDSQTIFSHRMPGAADEALLQETAELKLDAARDGSDLLVTVDVTNTGAGHDLPTDNPLRNLILLVEARDANGESLSLLDGSTIPDWGGVGDPADGYYAGLPGVLYAKILADTYTGETPTYAYWRQTRLVSDNRIAALATDRSSYRFRLPADDGEITVEARLLLRRAFIDLMDAKAWDTPDILMEQAALTVQTMTRPYLSLLGGVLALLAACSSPAALNLNQTAVYTPTPTIEITPVPLLLTPIATPQPLPALPPLTEGQSSKPLAAADDLLAAVNPDSDSLTLVDTGSLSAIAEIPLGGSPRTVALSPAAPIALVTLWDTNQLASVSLTDRRLQATYPIGHMPYGVVTDGRRAFVSLFADDQIAVFDLASQQIMYRVGVPDAPTGLALSGSWLLVTHQYNGTITVLNVERTPFVVGSVNAEPDGNLARAIILSPDGTRAYVPQTRTGLALVSLQYMQDWFPVVSVLDTQNMTTDRSARLTISALDGAVNLPADAAVSPDGRLLYVALAGSDAVRVIDLTTNQLIAHVPVGANPTGVVLDGDRAFALNALDGTLSVISTESNAVTDTVKLTDIPLDPLLLRGKILFNRAHAPELSDGAISCATCHLDGGADARTWINFRSGPRNTPALGGAAALPPYNWAGDMDELQDTIEDQIRHVMLGDGLIAGAFDATTNTQDAGRSADLDALTAYVASLNSWASPYRQADGSLSPSAQRGMTLFMSGSPDCSCHAPPLYTDQLAHNLAGAAFSLEEYEAIDTPSLRGLWATAPYMHDGVAQTLKEVFTRTDPIHSVAADLTDQQLDDLIAFLLSL